MFGLGMRLPPLLNIEASRETSEHGLSTLHESSRFEVCLPQTLHVGGGSHRTFLGSWFFSWLLSSSDWQFWGSCLFLVLFNHNWFLCDDWFFSDDWFFTDDWFFSRFLSRCLCGFFSRFLSWF